MVEPGDNGTKITELLPLSRLVFGLIDTFFKLLDSFIFAFFWSEKMLKIIVELLSIFDGPLAPEVTLFQSFLL